MRPLELEQNNVLPAHIKRNGSGKMKREETIRAILEKLISGNRQIGNRYSRDDIDKAIITVRGVDQRTRDNWFNVLWKLDYLLQPEKGWYSLNLSHLSELELKVAPPRPFLKNQTKLRRFL